MAHAVRNAAKLCSVAEGHKQAKRMPNVLLIPYIPPGCL
ncbi:hypothetical protein GAGA_0875 [Paraglaciecola agarilytica NO2]|uniref:Transposase n=1 Tax=Paraglaciecola agarilytica NO2 TaxID=1125747 RepID=A0ABQ0I344_9ALTE|nr:hypothetical protein GAGA_0875 [Paraglaciecola agarilytica NO2]